MRSKTTEYYYSGKTDFIIDIVQQLRKEGLIYFHHKALAAGYIRVGEAEIDLYNGRFGKGIIVKYNYPLSNRYCNIEYYLTDNMDNVFDRLGVWNE